MNIFGFPEFPYPGIMHTALTLSMVMTPAIEAAALTWLVARICRHFHRPLTRPVRWAVFAVIMVLMALALYASFSLHSPSSAHMTPVVRWLLIISMLAYFLSAYALAYGPVLIGFYLFHEDLFALATVATVATAIVIVIHRHHVRRRGMR